MNVLKPTVVVFLRGVRSDENSSILDCLDGWFCEWLHSHPPLRLQPRFNDVFRLLTYGDFHGVILPFDIQSFLFQHFNHLVARIEALHASEVTSVAIERAVVIQNVDEVKFMCLSDLEIVGIVGGRHLDGTCTKFRIDVLIHDDG